MPIPLLIAGVVAGGIGLIAGVSGRNDMKEAQEIAERAQKKAENAQQRLRSAGNRTNGALVDLGRAKLDASVKVLKRVVAVANRVHVGKDQMKLAEARGIDMPPVPIQDMERAAFTAETLLGAGAAGLTAGALAGAGALGLATTIGVASTGTAIGTLSGAAATNATLAWLGGGALNAGGFGIAGGMATAASVVAGPAIAILGIAMAIKADKELTKAKEYAAQVDVAVEEIETAIVKTRAIATRAAGVQLAINQLRKRIEPLLTGMEAVLDAKSSGRVEFEELSESEQGIYKILLMLGSALYQVIEIDIINELGEVTPASAKLIGQVNAMVQGITA